jgi:predicted enzyme related to lactoylglutathione lyase
MITLAKFVHINLIAQDWKRLAAFYQGVFGCIPIPPERNLSGQWLTDVTGVPDAHIRGVHVRLPGYGDEGPTLEIFQYAIEEERPSPTANRPGLGHIAFVVNDVDSMRNSVIAAGGKDVGRIVSVDIPGAGRLRLAYVADPEGNIIELQQPTP